MADLPLVSIVTPCFNQGRYIEKTILSVLEQHYPNIEYILMDGSSGDESLDVIQKYSARLSYWESKPDRGQADAINKGLQRAKGQILGWLNSDDILLPSTVRTIIETFCVRPEVDVIYGRLERIDASGQVVPTPILPKDRITFGKEYVIGECVVNQPGCFWRREIMEKVGLLDERLVYSMDYDYWIRMALAGAKFHKLPQVVARFRLSESSKTATQSAAMAREQLGVLEKYLSQPGMHNILGLPKGEFDRKSRRARSNICLHAFYGDFKAHHWRDAFSWLSKALRYNPLVLFQRRWFDLMYASLLRRF